MNLAYILLGNTAAATTTYLNYVHG